MIEGASDITRVMDLLRKLGVADVEMDVTAGATYAIAYKGQDMKIEVSGEYVEEVPTQEEAEIMFICDHGVEAWMNRMDDILLGDGDE